MALAAASSGSLRAGELVTRWPFLVAVVGLVVNDHFAKQAFPGAVTWKLSDVFGLFFFPLLLHAMWEVARHGLGAPIARRSDVSLAIACAATGLVFSVAKTSAWGAELVGWGMGVCQYAVLAPVRLLRGVAAGSPHAAVIAVDPTDLLALPAVAVAGWYATRRGRG